MEVMDFFDAAQLFAWGAVALRAVIFGNGNLSRVNLPETHLEVSRPPVCHEVLHTGAEGKCDGRTTCQSSVASSDAGV
jgi:hypothetical protein